MDNVCHSLPAPTLPEEAAFGLLTALSGLYTLSSRGWAFVDACRALASAGRLVEPGIRSWAIKITEADEDGELELRLCALAERGVLRAQGRGVAARWVVNESWRQGWEIAADGLDGPERQVWTEAAQSLKRCTSIWAKAAAAAASGSERSTSSTR